ncbi:MAG: ABC transporter permease subunit [Ardenticatenaceae bacterium]|nr:ABC transporter permease subunit [Ardenticatenaceae bacterium]
MRNTPLLLQLFFLYFGVILLLPPIREAIQPFGLPIFMSQRGIDMPWPVLMPSGNLLLIFALVAVIIATAIWVVLGRQEIAQGKRTYRPLWVLAVLLVIIAAGWFAARAAGTGNQAALVQTELGVTEFADLSGIVQQRLGIDNLTDVPQLVAAGTLSQEMVDAAALKVCALRDDSTEINLAAELRQASIPFAVQRFNRVNLVVDAFTAGECDLYVADQESLHAVADAGAQISVAELPLRLSLPSLQGLNFAGGYKLTPNFAAILIGLVLYTGAFIAEIVRAGIQSVPKGQSEAARALGLSETQRLQLVVLPQALRVIIPPLTSQYLNLVKNSSLAIAVGYPDLWSTAFITLNQSGQAVQVFIIVMASYLSFSLFISFLLNWYNQRIALVER